MQAASKEGCGRRGWNLQPSPWKEQTPPPPPREFLFNNLEQDPRAFRRGPQSESQLHGFGGWDAGMMRTS